MARLFNNRFLFLRSTYLFLIFPLFIHCKDSEDDVLRKYYTSDEIAELEKLSEFVLKEITTGCSGELEECYEGFFKKFEDLSGSNHNLDYSIDKKRQKTFLKNFNVDLHKDIWGQCRGSRSLGRDKKINTLSLCPSTRGRFAKFLQEYSEKRQDLGNYGESFILSGDYSPSLNAGLLLGFYPFDVNSKSERLLFSVHLLTLNHPYEILP